MGMIADACHCTAHPGCKMVPIVEDPPHVLVRFCNPMTVPVEFRIQAPRSPVVWFHQSRSSMPSPLISATPTICQVCGQLFHGSHIQERLCIPVTVPLGPSVQTPTTPVVALYQNRPASPVPTTLQACEHPLAAPHFWE